MEAGRLNHEPARTRQVREPEHARPTTWRSWLFGAVLVAVAFIAFGPALHGGFIWDDHMHITRPGLRTLSGLHRIWFDIGATLQYYPLLHTAFWIEHRLWGDATVGYHVVNLLLHLTSAFLVVRILRRLSLPGAWLTAAIFVLHPVQVESVAWISEQKNTLSGVFYLGAVLVYLRFDETRRAGTYLMALGLFICALLSKTVTATLSGALLVMLWWRRGELSWRRDVLPTVPFFVLGAGSGLITVWWELQINHSVGSDFQFSTVQRLLLAGRALCFHMGKLCWPARLSFMYARWNLDASSPWPYLFLLAVVGLATATWALRRQTRGPLAALLFFVGTLFPTLGFFNLYTFRYALVANHYQYLASLGLMTLFAAGVARARLGLGPGLRKIPELAAGILLLVLATLTWRQSGVFRSSDQVWIDTLDKTPGCWVAYNNLATSLAEQGQREKAFLYVGEAARLKPDDDEIQNNLGVMLATRGRVEEAIAHFREALDLNPRCAKAHYNLGLALAGKHETQEAIAHYREALKISPNMREARHSLEVELAGL